ncbi:hypothetical protein WDW86_16150 [Bdellovibrionota bacterium FG-2]
MTNPVSIQAVAIKLNNIIMLSLAALVSAHFARASDLAKIDTPILIVGGDFGAH